MKKKLRRLLPVFVGVLCVPLAFFLFTGLFGGKVDEETLRLAQQSVQRAAVQCYALEGAYPINLDYLKTRYGVSVDEDRYFVDYRYIASNLMPDIIVLPRTESANPFPEQP